MNRKPEEQLPEANPENPDDPHYRKPEPIRCEFNRPWPASSGESRWSEVKADLRENLEKALAAGIADSRWPIYLFGSVGTGKTCAAACIYRGWRGSALWFEASQLGAQINAARTGQGEETEKTIWNRIEHVGLLVLNDVGLRITKASESAFETQITALELRIHKPTIITSNLDPMLLSAAFDERYVSRVCAGTQIELIGEDRRAENSKYVRVKGSSI